MEKILHGTYKSLEKYFGIVYLLFTGIVLITSLSSLSTFPALFIDESWNSNAAWNYINTKTLSDPISYANFGQEYINRWPFIGLLPYVVSFKLWGLGLWQGRLASWLIGVVLLIVVFLFSKKFFSYATGALAVLLLSVSWIFLQSSHYIRPDITLALFVWLALFTYLLGNIHKKKWFFLISGLMIGFTLDIHPNGLLFAISLSFVHLLIYRRRVFREPVTYYFIAGALIAAAYYFGLRYHFDFRNSLQISPLDVKILPSPLFTLNPYQIIKGFYGEFGRYNFYNHTLDFVLIGASLAYIFIRWREIDRIILFFLTSSLILFALLSPNKHNIYAILFYPFFTLFIAESFIDIMREKKIFSPEGLFWGTALILILISFAIQYFRPIWTSRDYNYYTTAQSLQGVIPERAKVIGMPNWWLGLSATNFRSILDITHLHIIDGISLTEALRRLGPEYIIVDPAVRGLLVDQGYFALGSFDAYLFPRQEFVTYLDQNAMKILEYHALGDGLIEVYKINQ